MPSLPSSFPTFLEVSLIRLLSYLLNWPKRLGFLLPSEGARLFGMFVLSLLLAGCVTDNRHRMIISIADQKMLVLRDGRPLSSYSVSTSKFGVGDRPGSYATPLGVLRVKEKIGHGLPVGAVFKSRKPTGEVLPVDAPGRDPIVTRILWLEGLDERNRNAFLRYIYIHGTPEERNIGKPVSYGCIRMRSRDVIQLFETVGLNSKILITPNPLPSSLFTGVTGEKSQSLPDRH